MVKSALMNGMSMRDRNPDISHNMKGYIIMKMNYRIALRRSAHQMNTMHC